MALNTDHYMAMCEAAYVTTASHYSPTKVRQQIAAMLEHHINVPMDEPLK
jgi:hypothetical protein